MPGSFIRTLSNEYAVIPAAYRLVEISQTLELLAEARKKSGLMKVLLLSEHSNCDRIETDWADLAFLIGL
jgi:hypothetical protein